MQSIYEGVAIQAIAMDYINLALAPPTPAKKQCIDVLKAGSLGKEAAKEDIDEAITVGNEDKMSSDKKND